MEPQKAPEQPLADVPTNGTVPAPADPVAPRAEAALATEPAVPEAAPADKPTAELPKPAPAAEKSPAQPKTSAGVPTGFILFGVVILAVLLLLAFIAYSKQ